MNYDELITTLDELLKPAQRIVVMQADNPDGDSLSSALALEAILGAAGKDVYLYCAIDMPEHLRYLEGWDRVQKEFPSNFDLAFTVDCGYWQLFGHFQDDYGQGRLPKDKLVVIDEHDDTHTMQGIVDFQDVEAVSSGQIIFEIFSRLGWDIDKLAATFIASSIMSDTLGFTSDVLVGRPRPFEIMAKLIEKGLNLGELQERRLEGMKINAETLRYKGELLQRVEYYDSGKIALITIPYDELRAFSNDYNPTVILDETRLVRGVAVTIGLKQYVSQGQLVRVTGRIRCNRGFSIAKELAETFEGGGGHPYASGFKIDGKNIDFASIKQQIIDSATRLLAEKHPEL